MVRPRLEKGDRRVHRVVFRITDTERLLLAQRAAAAGLRLNDFARSMTLAQVRGGFPKGGQGTYDPALVRQLYAIGHNLNQLTKNAHIFKRVSPQVGPLCERIEKLMDEAVGKVGE